MKTKSIILTVSAFLIATTLCACSSNASTSSTPDSTPTTSGTSTTDNSSDESSNESVESSNKSDENSNNSSEEQIDINSIKAEVLTDKSFWSKFGSITYDGKTISLSDDFDDLKLCTDESIGNEIIDRVTRQRLFDQKVDFCSGYEAIKNGKEMINATRAEIDEFIKKNAVYGNYLEANPDFFGFSDMKGFYEKASELYTGFTYDNFKDFIPDKYAEYDGKLCIYAAFGEKGSGDERYYQAKYLLFYDDQNNNDIMCITAIPTGVDKNNEITYALCAYKFENTDNGLRCKVSSTIARCGLYEDFKNTRG